VSTVRNTIGRITRAEAELIHSRTTRIFLSSNPIVGSEHVLFGTCESERDASCTGVVAAVQYENQHARFTLAIYATGDCERCQTVCEEWGILELAISPTTKRMNARTAAELGAAYRVDHKLLMSIGALCVDELTGPGGPTTNGAEQ
jgi:hypothetical protein